ncbi:Spy/CpxP family protein refolding chaperone [Polaromonas aquatica]|uniref:Spy/CpxP family protein refolding chaperone n=1 Tax=Polaromonas aquatica TaxID=332657 RepID=UPI003D64B5C8
MKFAFNHTASLNSLVLAGLLATVGTGAMAQTPAAPPAGSPPVAGKPAGPHEGRMGHRDPAKMQAMIAKHQGELKAKLKLTPAQEGAWTSYTASMQPPVHGARPTPEQRAEFDKLTTPQRIDKMKELRTQRMAEMNAAMDKRGEATKTFYAALTPEQQKTFDAEHKKHGFRHGGARGHGGPAAQKG